MGFTIAKRLLWGKIFVGNEASLKFNGECSLITVNWVLSLSTESSRSSLNICFGSFAQSVCLLLLQKKKGKMFCSSEWVQSIHYSNYILLFKVLLWRLLIFFCVSKTLIIPAISKNFLLWNIHTAKKYLSDTNEVFIVFVVSKYPWERYNTWQVSDLLNQNKINQILVLFIVVNSSS